MKLINIRKSLLSLSIILSFIAMTGCNDQWDDHVEVKTSTLSGTIMDAIAKDSNLSTFASMLKTTGYDYVLRSGSEFTVFAPNNDALSSYVTASDSIKKLIVKNHITFLKHNASQLADLKTLRSVNGKNLTISSLTFPETDVESLCSNGILRTVTDVVMPKQNILEYLTNTVGKGKYEQVDWLLNATDSVADLANSIQTGVNSSGQPVYDTLKVAYNRFLNKVSYSNEDSTYTFALLPNVVFDVLKVKYAKYMKPAPDNVSLKWQQTLTDAAIARQSVMADSIATDELITDLTFHTGSLLSGKQTNVNGVNVDLNALGTTTILSNGSVQIVTDAGIILKNNKIKPIVIQGEEFDSALDPSCVITRIRSYASGGKDVYLASELYQTRDSLDANGVKTGTTISYLFNKSATNTETTRVNTWIQYLTKLYTCDYKMYWKSYDDFSDHVHKTATNGATYDPSYDPTNPTKICPSTMNVGMKLYASFSGYPNLVRSSSTPEGLILNNWADTGLKTGSDSYYAFASTNNAGCNREQQLYLYRLNVTWSTKTLAWGTDPGSVNTSGAVSRDNQLLSVATYGQTHFWVTNSYFTTSTSSTRNGWIFLDYIRLEPQINE